MFAGGQPLEIRALRPSKIGKASWNAFVAGFGQTIQSNYEKLRVLPIKYRWARTFGVFDLELLVGYFTVVKDAGAYRFYNGVNLYSKYESRWAEVMNLALREIGPGRYAYGWRWSVHASRNAEIANLDGVDLERSHNYVVQGVDLSRWDTWECFHKSISSNSKRNAKKTLADHPDIAVLFKRGYAALPVIPRLVWYKWRLCGRKKIAFSPIKSLLGYSIRLILTPAQFVFAEAVSKGKVLSIFRLVMENDMTYYFEGASHPDCHASSLLQLAVLEHVHTRNPGAKYIMGWRYREGASDPDLIRSREALRVSEWETSVTEFTYRPKEGRSGSNAVGESSPRWEPSAYAVEHGLEEAGGRRRAVESAQSAPAPEAPSRIFQKSAGGRY